jgi:peptidoglycan/xylan/chitin deacetylase (PgdA/CDA1 family)
MAKRNATERLEIRDMLLNKFGPPDLSRRAPLISADDLKELVSLGVEIGNHTMNHVHCRSLTSAEMQTEIVAAKAKLEDLSGSPVRSFSVPYGHHDDLTPEVLDCVRTSGHLATFLVHSRSNWRQPAPDIWYRTSLHHEPAQALRTELKVKPMIRSLKQMMTG